jgi:hypothetical protein
MRGLAILAIIALLVRPAFGDGKKLVVVVARGSAVTDISRTDLKRCFFNDTVSVKGTTLVPFNAQPSTAERGGFDRAVLGMSPDQAGRFWVDRKVRGQGGPPRSLPSNTYIAKVVAKFPGAIGYLPVDQLTADVQPVAVDGVPYTDPRYGITTD